MNTTSKRKDNMDDNKTLKRAKKECSYGDGCYRRNPAHFREFSHQHLEAILDEYKGDGPFPIPQKYSLQKQSIKEQLEIIIEKQLYSPRNKVENGDAGCSSTNESLSSTEKDPSNNLDVNKNTSNEVQSKENNEKNGSCTENVKNPPSSSRENSKNVDNLDVRKREKSKSPTTSRENTINRPRDSDYRPIVPPTRRAEDYLKVVLPRGKMAAKHDASAPYHIFYTTIADERRTHSQPYSITFLELLDHSLGELKCSLQINFMVELGWLLAQYYFAGYSKKKMTILYGEEMEDLKTINKKKPHIDAHHVTMATPFGKHHTKMMILCYEDGSLRVVVSTANLYVDDWENRTQGLWLSPRCPELPPDAMPHDGESPTMFKRSLLRYLNHYHLPQLAFYMERVKRCDFSHINVFLVASIPGSHFDMEWGMTRAGTLLRQHCAIPAHENTQWPLIAMRVPCGVDPGFTFRHGVGYDPCWDSVKAALRYTGKSEHSVAADDSGWSLDGVFLVASIPGSHFDMEWGMTHAGTLLRQHCAIPAHENSQWPLIAQASSIGSFGKEPKLWLTGDFLQHFTKIKSPPQVLSQPPQLKLIYPSLENVRQSHDGLLGGGCLPYGADAHTKQMWLNDYLFQWKATSTYRDKAMPHIKSYTRVSPDNSRAAYYLLTSGNVSKAAWGQRNKKDQALRLMSCEAGVLFLPQFVIKEDFFPLKEGSPNRLVLPYDIPPTKYSPDMSPWVSDYLR